MILPWVLGSILAGVILRRLAGRFAIVVGLFVMAALFLYAATASPQGDPNSAGMLATIVFVLVDPAGLTAITTGLWRK